MSNSNNIEIIKFSSPTCIPCKVMTGVVNKLLEVYPSIILKEYDITKDEIPDGYLVRSVPAIFINKNNERYPFIGIHTYDELLNVINDK